MKLKFFLWAVAMTLSFTQASFSQSNKRAKTIEKDIRENKREREKDRREFSRELVKDRNERYRENDKDRRERERERRKDRKEINKAIDKTLKK